MKIYSYSVYVILILGCLGISCEAWKEVADEEEQSDIENLNKGTLLLLVAYKKKYYQPIYDDNSQIYDNIENEMEYDDHDDISKEKKGKGIENVKETKSPNPMMRSMMNSNNPINVVSKERSADDYDGDHKKEGRNKRDTHGVRRRHKFRPSPLLSGG